MKDRSQGWLTDALERYERRLVHYADRLVGDLDAARDIVQDTYLRLCRQRRESLDGRMAEWLFTVCRHRAIDHLRKQGRMDTLESNEVITETTTPDARAEQREEAGRVLATIRELPTRQQEVLHLKFREGLSYRQISAITGASVSNVGFLLHTAIKTLRARLASPAGSKS